MTPDDYPFCGAELLPHAVAADGTPAPIVCTLPLHGRDVRHGSDEPSMLWAWQHADGSWVRS